MEVALQKLRVLNRYHIIVRPYYAIYAHMLTQHNQEIGCLTLSPLEGWGSRLCTEEVRQDAKPEVQIHQTYVGHKMYRPLAVM